MSLESFEFPVDFPNCSLGLPSINKIITIDNLPKNNNYWPVFRRKKHSSMWCHSFILRFGSKTLWVCSAISLWIFKNSQIGQTLTESAKSISDISTGRLNWVAKFSLTGKMHVLTVSKRYQAEEIFFGRYGEVIVLLQALKQSFIDLEEFVEVEDPASWACLVTPFSNSNCIVSEINHFFDFLHINLCLLL